jgi:hypothetical protein
VAAADFIKRFANFSAGEFGVVDPGKAPDNSFSGRNVVLYESGLVGVRPGLKSLPVTGLPDHTEQPGPAGFDVYNDNLVVVVDDEVFRVPIAAPAAVSMGTYAARATSFVRFTEGDNFLYSISEGLLYKHANDTTVNVALPAGVQLSTITRWGYYLIGADANVPWRLYFSKVSEAGPEFDVWEANAYVDIGGNSEIVALKPMFNQLLVGKPEGWWSLTGVLSLNPSVRALESGNGPLDQRAVATTTDNRVVYWGQETLPHWFNGSTVWLDENYRISRYNTTYPLDMVVATPTGKRIIMLGQAEDSLLDDTMLINREREWTVHELPVQLSGLAPSDVRHAYQLPGGVVFGAIRNDNVGDPVQIVSLQHDLERPAHVDDDWASPIDEWSSPSELVSGAMATPAWYDAQGRQVMVRNVQVLFRKWPSGVAGTLNELHVRVRPLARWHAGTLNTESQLWTEPSERAALDGSDDSISFNFGAEGTALGFQIEIPIMKGIAIREINVACEVTTRRM